MKPKFFVYIATSLEGFITKPDGDIEWLHSQEYDQMSSGGLRYEQFISGIDAIVMGRNTFEKYWNLIHGRMKAHLLLC